MANFIRCWVSFLALVMTASAVLSAEHAARDQHNLPNAFLLVSSTEDDCEARIDKLDDSQAEGEDRLREKYAVIDYCGRQYKNDKTIGRLVKECAKYEEQPVVKQQFLAECILAAYKYANALGELKAEHRK